ncbi:hypothetical protein L211DRAFT_779165 [Terfezia boudieri ATCC MYA-4762]|uniref:Integral membrane protein, Mpv17/PMP22 family n=1 Tax=Terfezia boudieri ATCC MYA-4762 TaxID=1051890 RepID=A0A3N4MEF8_9PEZI|nr:hypothetical protein L211DRAFT_779165 [Terfezia boudieri ATCC MYA-4762]
MPSAVVISTIQGTILSVFSNILAQCIKAYRSDTPLSLNPTPTLTFALYSILSTPPNYFWQELLESWFPSYTTPPSPPTSKSEGSIQQSLSTSNTIKKFLADQAISAPLNTLAFLAFMKGSALASRSHTSMSELLWEVVRDFPALHIASLKLWPAVGLLSFTLIPVERRVVFGSFVALGWNIYLGLAMS